MKLIFLLEEPSAKEFLEHLLPRLLPATVSFKCIAHEGKSDLEKRIIYKLNGWKEDNVKFVILRDQDSSNCHDIKQKIINICKRSKHKDTLIRIACHEWF